MYGYFMAKVSFSTEIYLFILLCLISKPITALSIATVFGCMCATALNPGSDYLKQLNQQGTDSNAESWFCSQRMTLSHGGAVQI